MKKKYSALTLVFCLSFVLLILSGCGNADVKNEADYIGTYTSSWIEGAVLPEYRLTFKLTVTKERTVVLEGMNRAGVVTRTGSGTWRQQIKRRLWDFMLIKLSVRL
jgi:hypothetical protein